MEDIVKYTEILIIPEVAVQSVFGVNGREILLSQQMTISSPGYLFRRNFSIAQQAGFDKPLPHKNADLELRMHTSAVVMSRAQLGDKHLINDCVAQIIRRVHQWWIPGSLFFPLPFAPHPLLRAWEHGYPPLCCVNILKDITLYAWRDDWPY